MLIPKKHKELDNSESRLTYLINQLSNNLDDNEELNKTYNRLLIERATIRNNIVKTRSKNVLVNFCEKLKKTNDYSISRQNSGSALALPFYNKKQCGKLICDYFKNS